MSAKIIPYVPPVDDIIVKLGMATDQLRNTAWSDIVAARVEQPETGREICGYAALKHIAIIIDSIAESALAYAQANGQRRNGGAA
jgi:hypothetical protein